MSALSTSQRSVLVIGGGIAGLAAARSLAESGCAVTLLEASNRLGGRVHSRTADGVTVELGAEFVHGQPPELIALLQELGLEVTERNGAMVLFHNDGRLTEQSWDDDDPENDEPDAFGVIEQLRTWSDARPATDMSFADWIATQELPESSRASATGYAEGFNAADAHELSIRSLALQQAAEDEIAGDTGFHVRGGYARLAEGLADRVRAAGGTIRKEAHVSALRWEAGAVTAELADEELLQASAAVIALTLGVLQAGVVAITPQPALILQHAQRMRMGKVCRISLVFRRRWWAELDHPQHAALGRLSFLIGADRETGTALHPRFPVFWTSLPETDAVVTAWTGGPHADAFAALDDHAIAHLACAELARIFCLPREAVLDELTAHHSHDWQRDPLALGAYSWVPVGAVDASAKMCEPVENTLFFAGEHTDTTGHWGTVHGALRSGLRAAKQVLAAQNHSAS